MNMKQHSDSKKSPKTPKPNIPPAPHPQFPNGKNIITCCVIPPDCKCKQKCKWTITIEQVYNTSCKHSFFFIEGDLKNNPDFKHCPYCGKEIVEK
jgi:hypothetical protein